MAQTTWANISTTWTTETNNWDEFVEVFTIAGDVVFALAMTDILIEVLTWTPEVAASDTWIAEDGV